MLRTGTSTVIRGTACIRAPWCPCWPLSLGAIILRVHAPVEGPPEGVHPPNWGTLRGGCPQGNSKVFPSSRIKH